MSEHAPQSPLALVGIPHQWAARSLDSILTPHGYAVVRAVDARQVREQARQGRPDVLLLDLALPDSSGLELCRRLRQDEIVAATTPILLTGQEPVTRELRLQALRAGAWEYFAFPLDAEELILKLSVYLEAKFLADRCRNESLLDPLTGCYSARGLLRRARELAADADRHERALACVALAPEAARPARQARRQELSTAVVRQFGELLGTHTRGSDTVGRMSRGEFVVLAPETDAPGALRLAQRLSDAVRAASFDDTSRLGLRAGYFAVPDFRRAPVEPVEMMVRATLALRQAQAGPDAPPIQFFRSGEAPA
jgi:diguanylate cyclase (GGDEF)-like protein